MIIDIKVLYKSILSYRGHIRLAQDGKYHRMIIENLVKWKNKVA